MSAIGPNSQSLNYTHMFDMYDINGIYPLIKYNKNSITDFLNSNKNFCKFKRILDLSGMTNIFDDKQANFTLFVTPDNYFTNIDNIILTTMDQATARCIIKSHSLNNKITTDIFRTTRAGYYYTENNPLRRLIIISPNNDIIIDNDAKIIKGDISATNGIIHIIDKCLYKPY
jgi:uncharacterized surface protein with fasciclin (FAS1) repeats